MLPFLTLLPAPHACLFHRQACGDTTINQVTVGYLAPISCDHFFQVKRRASARDAFRGGVIDELTRSHSLLTHGGWVVCTAHVCRSCPAASVAQCSTIIKSSPVTPFPPTLPL